MAQVLPAAVRRDKGRRNSDRKALALVGQEAEDQVEVE